MGCYHDILIILLFIVITLEGLNLAKNNTFFTIFFGGAIGAM